MKKKTVRIIGASASAAMILIGLMLAVLTNDAGSLPVGISALLLGAWLLYLTVTA